MLLKKKRLLLPDFSYQFFPQEDENFPKPVPVFRGQAFSLSDSPDLALPGGKPWPWAVQIPRAIEQAEPAGLGKLR